jgi:hypothetical protein
MVVMASWLTVDSSSLVVNADDDYVGIGTASPRDSLHVASNADIDGNLSVDTVNARTIAGAGGGAATIGSLDVTSELTASGRLYTEINILSISGNTTVSAADCYGTVIYCDGTSLIDLPAIANGMNLTICTIGAKGIQVNPNSSDKIWLDGTALADGDRINNISTSGNIAVLTYFSADGWYASTDSWTDGD